MALTTKPVPETPGGAAPRLGGLPVAAEPEKTLPPGAPPKTRAAHLVLGAQGEEEAARDLAQKGFIILERNWRPSGVLRGLEIDIVARHRDTLVFVEVKTRSGMRDGAVPAYAAFTARKKNTLVKAARLYMAAHDLWQLPCRFDLVCVEYMENNPDGAAARHRNHAPGGMVLEHHANVIELGKTVDSGNASWQPW